MRRLLLALPLLVAAPLIAQQPMAAPGSRNPALVTGGHYAADPEHTLIEWELDHLGFTPYFGLFGQITGTLQLDPRNPDAAKVDVVIPVSKVTTASAGLTSHLLKAPAPGGARPDFFGVSPADARFVSTRVATRGQSATITGNLTLNGVTRPVTLAARFYGAGRMPEQMGGKENVGFTAQASLRRSDFGLGFGLPMVGDEVKLKISAAFLKEGGVDGGTASSPCRADKAATFVGRRATPAVRARVAAAVGQRAIRWRLPNDVVTQDFSESRLNMMLDRSGRITSARCG